jgi:hypothetical protein
MRLTGLLAILLFVVIVFFAAPAASCAQTASAPAIKTENADANPVSILPDKPRLDREPAAPMSAERPLLLAQPLMEHGGDLVLRESPDSDGLCYTMRTYVMAREDKTSDSTRLVRQLKCTPARKFGFKSADIRVDKPPDAKLVTK